MRAILSFLGFQSSFNMCVIFLNFMSLILEGLHTDLWPSTWPLSESIMAPYASLLSKSWKCSPATKGSCVMSGQ